jgi:hypothetical protein
MHRTVVLLGNLTLNIHLLLCKIKEAKNQCAPLPTLSAHTMNDKTPEIPERRGIPTGAVLAFGAVLLIGCGTWCYVKYFGQTTVSSPGLYSSPVTSSLQTVSAEADLSGASSTIATSTTFDRSNWLTLNNKYGWSLQYPPSWVANGNDGNAPSEDAAPYLQGPTDCYSKHQECGYFSISLWLGSIFPNAKTTALNAMSAKDFLLATQFPIPPDPNRALLSQGESTIDGVSAYFVVFRQTNFENYPNGIIMKEIEIKSQGKFFLVAYYETGQDKASVASIASPNDWQLNGVFGEILSTVKLPH